MRGLWSQLQPPSADYIWKLRTSVSPIRTSVGRHADGHIAFMLEMKFDHADLLMRLPEIQGLTLDYRMFAGAGSYGLIVALREAKDEELFATLCEDLAACIEDLTEERQAVLSFLSRLDRWQRFLARNGRRLLSTDGIRGLVAELEILGLLISDNGRSAADALTGWVGPLRAAQDFRFADQLIEVKSWGGSGGAKVRISSEFQLQVDDVPVFLAAVQLVEEGEPKLGHSLNEVVTALKSILPADVLDQFEDRLGAAGYIELPYYDAPRFRLGAIDFFGVTEEFPVLTPRQLPTAVSGVQYTLDLVQLSGFRVAELPGPTL